MEIWKAKEKEKRVKYVEMLEAVKVRIDALN